MSAYAAAMSRGLAGLYRKNGEAAQYFAHDGFPTDCTVIVNRDATTLGDALEVTAQSVLISVRVSEVCERPRTRERFFLPETGEEFIVDQVAGTDELEHKVIAV